jgi:hypothetical protein
VLARERLLARDQPVGALDDRHLRAERAVRLRHLDGDHTAAEDRQAIGDLLRRRGLAVGPRLGLPQPVDGRDRRRRAGGHDDGLARDERLPAGLHAPLSRDAAGGADHGYTAALEPWHLVRVVQVVDDLVAALQDRLGVEVARHRLAHARDAAHLGQQLAGPEHRLRRHARVEGALAPDQVRLEDGHVEARLAEPPRAYLPGRPCSKDDHVEFALGHAEHGTLPAWPPQTHS